MSTDINLTIVIISLAFVILIYLSKTTLRFFFRNNPVLTEKFFNELDIKYELGLIKSKEDIIILADSFKREYRSAYELTDLLEDYLRYLVSKARHADKQSKEILIERHNKASEILKIESEEKPYSDLPNEERRIFRALNSSIREDNKQDAFNELDDLRILISTKNKIAQQSNFLNKLSIPLAIIGLILTIYFGYKSLPAEKKSIKTYSTPKIEQKGKEQK